MTQNPNFQDILRRVLLPGLAGAVGTGAASGYLSSKNHDPNETKGMRRRRILRNAMYGTALGGVAGAALPTGAGVLAKSISGFSPFEVGDSGNRGLTGNTLAMSGLRHALPIGVAGAGGYGLHRSMVHNRGMAVRDIAQALHNKPLDLDDLTKVSPRAAQISNLLKTEHGKYRIAELLGAAKEGENPSLSHGLFHANEMIQATGHPGMSLAEMGTRYGTHAGVRSVPPYDPEGVKALGAEMRSQVLPHYKDYLRSQSNPISKLMSVFATDKVPMLQKLKEMKYMKMLAERSPMAERALGSVADFNPSAIAENYGRYFRPSMSSAIESVPPAAKLMLLGGGVLGANHLQKKLMGQ